MTIFEPEDEKGMIVTIVDTPGLGDPEGNSIMFLDSIINDFIANPPDLILFVVPHS